MFNVKLWEIWHSWICVFPRRNWLELCNTCPLSGLLEVQLGIATLGLCHPLCNLCGCRNHSSLCPTGRHFMNLRKSQIFGRSKEERLGPCWQHGASRAGAEVFQTASRPSWHQSNRRSLVLYLKYGFVPEVDPRLKQSLSSGTSFATVGLINDNQTGSFNSPQHIFSLSFSETCPH